MTIEQLIETLNLMIDSAKCRSTDAVLFRQKDSSGRSEHSVDYILYGTIDDGKIVLCEEWM